MAATNLTPVRLLPNASHRLAFLLPVITTCRGALDCRAKAVNEEMKRAATYAIAALAKRPAMKRKTVSAGDLINLAAASAQQPGVAASTGAPTSSSSTLSTDQSGTVGNGSGGSCASDRSSSPFRSTSPCTHTGAAGSLCSKGHHHHKHAGSAGKHLSHLRRKSYGEQCFYTAQGGDQAPKFGVQ